MLKRKSEESASESPLISIFVSRIRDFRPKGQNLIRKKSKARRTRQTLWRAVQMLTQKLCCQTIHDCPKVVPLHYESEWQ